MQTSPDMGAPRRPALGKEMKRRKIENSSKIQVH
jgi:hypothetical protein